MTALGRLGALGLLIVMGTMWGLQFAMLKLAAESGHAEINVLTTALVLLSVIFTGILLARREIFRLTAERLLFFVVIGLLGYVVPLAAALHAAPHITAGLLTLIATLAPVVTISVALLLRSEAVSMRRLLAVAFGSAAVLFILWPEVTLPDFGAAGWMAVALIVPFCYGVESVYIARYWPLGLTALQAVTGETLMATAMMLPVFALYGEPIMPSASWSSGHMAIGVFVLAGVIESLIYFYLIQKTGGVFVSFGTFISLFAGIAWGIVLFSEVHDLAVWFAVAALCVSLALATRDRPVPIAARD